MGRRWVNLFYFCSTFHGRQSGRYGGSEAGPACVIWDVQHREAMGVNSMTERFWPPEELISQECDGQAIIASGTLLFSPGQVAASEEEY